MIQHPTGKQPKTINLLALGPTLADYHAAHFKYDPVVPEVDETWTLNKGFRTCSADLCFILDDLEGERRISKRYGDEINRLDIPVITTVVDDTVLQSYPDVKLVEYPITKILEFWGALWHINQGLDEGDIKDAALKNALYLKNSIPMILAYAGAIGVKTIHLFGADYDFPGANIHEADKANTEYWCGACRFGLGMKIILSSRTTLLSTNQGNSIYGYGKRQPAL